MEKQTAELYAGLLAYAASLHAQNKTSWEIKEALKEKGLPDDLAEKIIEQSRLVNTKSQLESSNKAIIWGSLLFVGGLAVTLISLKSSGHGYIIAYGAILGGLGRIIVGIIQRNNI